MISCHVLKFKLICWRNTLRTTEAKKSWQTELEARGNLSDHLSNSLRAQLSSSVGHCSQGLMRKMLQNCLVFIISGLESE